MARTEADWVVVGEGSAGCVLAARLSDGMWVADAATGYFVGRAAAA